ncbi:MAG TPA: FG-GAP repeat protein, partial [Thermoanaerobaculia bacterium]
TTGAFEKPRSLTGARDSYYAPAHAVADVNGDGYDDLVLHRDAVLTYFYGTPGGLLEHGRYLGTDLPYIARRSSSRFPGVVYSSVPGELVVLENECLPVKRRGVRH